MKLISWNVRNCGKNGVAALVDALSTRKPQVVALQDINRTSVAHFEAAFSRIGLSHVVHTLHDDSEIHPTGVLVASCFRIDRLLSASYAILWPTGPSSPHREKIAKHWSRRTLFVTVNSHQGAVQLYNVYVTPGVHKEYVEDKKVEYPWLKIDLLSGSYQTLCMNTDTLRILCGDFNTPQEEYCDGKIITWGYWKEKSGEYTLDDPQLHDAEIRILQGLAAYDMSDVYRSLHGYANTSSKEIWNWKNRRYDHIFASKALSPQTVEYLQAFRIDRLSDHAPIEVIFEPDKIETNGSL